MKGDLATIARRKKLMEDLTQYLIELGAAAGTLPFALDDVIAAGNKFYSDAMPHWHNEAAAEIRAAHAITVEKLRKLENDLYREYV